MTIKNLLLKLQSIENLDANVYIGIKELNASGKLQSHCDIYVGMVVNELVITSYNNAKNDTSSLGIKVTNIRELISAILKTQEKSPFAMELSNVKLKMIGNDCVLTAKNVSDIDIAKSHITIYGATNFTK